MPATLQERGFLHAASILRLYRTITRGDLTPRHIATQMLRAGTAIGANLEEAKSASSRRDLAAKQFIALREARECLYWLRLVESDRPDLAAALSPLIDECDQLIAMLTTSVKKLRGG